MTNDSGRALTLLNDSGFPFQHACAHRIALLDGYQLAVEVPFTHPVTNGPLVGLHGTSDIIAVHPARSADLLVCFVIECKRASARIKNWVFVTNQRQSPRWPTFIYSTQLPAQGNQLAVTRSVTFPELGYQRGRDFDFCVNWVETNAALNELNRDQTQRIYAPLKQAAHGTRALEAVAPKLVEGIEYFRLPSFTQTLYVPTVVTTAAIYVVTIPADRVVDGELTPDSLVLGEPRKWTTVEFGMPDYLGYSVRRGTGQTGVTKRTIFVVSDRHLEEFCAGALAVRNLSSTPTE